MGEKLQAMATPIFVFLGVIVSTIGGVLVAVFNKNIKLVNIEHSLDEVKKTLETHNGYAKKIEEVNDKVDAMDKRLIAIETKMEVSMSCIQKELERISKKN